MEISKSKYYKKLDFFGFLSALIIYFVIIFIITWFFVDSQKHKELPQVVMVLELVDEPTAMGGGEAHEITVLARTFGSEVSLLNLLKTSVTNEKPQEQETEDKSQETKKRGQNRWNFIAKT